MRGADHSQRVLFFTAEGQHEMLSLYLLADVVLDTFPAGGFIDSLQVRSMMMMMRVDMSFMTMTMMVMLMLKKKQSLMPLGLHRRRWRSVRRW
jgi:hypothetical protein